MQRESERVAAGECHRDARDRDENGGNADAHQLFEIGLQSDQKQQKHDAELREKVNRLVRGIDDAQSGDADSNAANQLAEYRRLPDALSDLAEEFRGDEDGDEREEEVGDGHSSRLSRATRHHNSSIALYTPSFASGTYSNPRLSGSS